ncbi:MAG TPA: M81 family metallopeptidase [Steroidobacter sp.]|uniref:M81 family metallopeptidase n=1 Tax=Steroidobacter sp. TaxID=1978227 RepID=UPI002ED8296E
MRVLVAGFQHETNTFAGSVASLESFVRGEIFPRLARGADILALRGTNLPVGGALEELDAAGYTVLPVIWAGACPSGPVTREAYESIVGEIVSAARANANVIDAVYLDLHGAMVAEHVDDCEGELLRRLRAVLGTKVPIVASLDLHANVTESMLQLADALVAYRTYPHVDMAETGARAVRALRGLPGHSDRLQVAARRVPFLIPVNSGCTLCDPAKSIFEELSALERATGCLLSFTPGFPAADFPGCGPVVWGYGSDMSELQRAVDSLFQRIVERESAWALDLLTPLEAVREAQRLALHASRPIVIADTQDNPGAGADSDTTGLLRALLECGAKDAALGLLWDPLAAAAAHEAGVGRRITLELGGRSGSPGDEPLGGEFRVEYLSDGKCVYEGPMMTGARLDLGRMACLAIDGVRVAVSSVKAQMFDRGLYRVVGIEPERMKILVNKSSVHFRADFGPIAERILVARSPGPFTADPGDLNWKRLAPGIRVRPNGPAFRNQS